MEKPFALVGYTLKRRQKKQEGKGDEKFSEVYYHTLFIRWNNGSTFTGAHWSSIQFLIEFPIVVEGDVSIGVKFYDGFCADQTVALSLEISETERLASGFCF